MLFGWDFIRKCEQGEPLGARTSKIRVYRGPWSLGLVQNTSKKVNVEVGSKVVIDIGSRRTLPP